MKHKNHAIISNGPFYLEEYSPESRTITVGAFNDESYPFSIGKWSEFEKAEFPEIKKAHMKKIIQRGEEMNITIEIIHSDSILYFLTNNKGNTILSETLKVKEGNTAFSITSENTKELGTGASNIKIFAISNSVLKPDFYESSFMVTENKIELPNSFSKNIEFSENRIEYEFWILPIIAIIGITAYLIKRHHSNP